MKKQRMLDVIKAESSWKSRRVWKGSGGYGEGLVEIFVCRWENIEGIEREMSRSKALHEEPRSTIFTVRSSILYIRGDGEGSKNEIRTFSGVLTEPKLEVAPFHLVVDEGCGPQRRPAVTIGTIGP